MQYLERIRLQNLRFGDDIRFEGIWVEGKNRRLVVSQPDVPGHIPDLQTIELLMGTQFGYRRLAIPPMGFYKSMSYLRFLTGVFDAHPANFRLTPDGVLVPIDVIPVRFSKADAAVLRQAVC